MNGADRRPWLIISRREATAIVEVLRDYLDGAPKIEAEDLRRAERVLTLQLGYIKDGVGRETGITDALIREMRT